MYVCHLVFRAHRGAPSRLINYQKKVVAVQQPPLVNFKSHTVCVNVFSPKVLGKDNVFTFPTGNGTRLHNGPWSYIRATRSRLKI